MKKNSFKDFYQNRGGKAIFFFGFYLIFFLVLASFIKSVQDTKEKSSNLLEENTISTITTIHDLFENDFSYSFEIEDDDNIITFNGSKSSIDYNDYEYPYFLDYVNINQLIKKSKVTKAGQVMTYYELSNQTLNDILNTNMPDGVNTISEFYGTGSQNEGTYTVILDLKEYMGKEKFMIKLNYKVGDKSE